MEYFIILLAVLLGIAYLGNTIRSRFIEIVAILSEIRDSLNEMKKWV